MLTLKTILGLECKVCGRMRDEEKRSNTVILAALFGHAKYAVCPGCQQEMDKSQWTPRYKRAWTRRVNAIEAAVKQTGAAIEATSWLDEYCANCNQSPCICTPEAKAEYTKLVAKMRERVEHVQCAVMEAAKETTKPVREPTDKELRRASDILDWLAVNADGGWMIGHGPNRYLAQAIIATEPLRYPGAQPSEVYKNKRHK